ncbi:MAG: ABC transporter permease [Oscillospiraceae bacterium]|nr:ABC transporter permease [Oscillospiraceae bacterium]MBR0457063.1 ABC transporter permease [Bacillota bacterium]
MKRKTNSSPKSRTLSEEAWYRFKKNRLAVIAMILLILLSIMAISTVVIDLVTHNTVYNQYVTKQRLVDRLQPPSKEHILGLDEFGRDILIRIIWGTRYSLFMGAIAICVAALVGGIIGALAGYYSIIDNLLMRIMDIFLAIPTTLLAVAIVAAMGPSLVNVVIAIAISQTPSFARVIRAQVLTIKDLEFIEAAKCEGASDFRIITRYIMPNALSPMIVQITMGMASAILSIASLSFIGMGVQQPMPEWGAMLSNARTYIRDAWHITAMPGMAIMITILILNIIGDGLRDALDPRMKK